MEQGHQQMFRVGVPKAKLVRGILRIKLLLGFERYKCGKSGCSGWMNDDEFEIKVQTDKCLEEGGKEVKEVDKLPWPEDLSGDLSSDEEEILSELKKVAPLNGRSVLLFKAKCGCPYAKIEAWSSEDNKRRHADASIQERIISGEAAVCCICKKNYANISEIKELPCTHFFHKECIDNSLKTDPLCPLCYSWDDYVMVSSDDVCCHDFYQ